MMGHSHALSGLLVGALTVEHAPNQTLAGQSAWVAACGGMAMLVDLDAKGSTVARMWGPVTALPSQLIGKVAGGHRNGTHCLFGAAMFFVLATLACARQWPSVILMALAIGLALRALAFGIPGKTETTMIGNAVVSFAAAWWFHVHGVDMTWLPAAVLVGVLTHIAGDTLTKDGCPWGWPFTKKRVALGLFTTGTWPETYVIAPVMAAGTVWVCDQRQLLGVPRVVDVAQSILAVPFGTHQVMTRQLVALAVAALVAYIASKDTHTARGRTHPR